MFTPSQTELAWSAGFFDGEGTTCNTGIRSVKLSISQSGEYAVYSLSRFSKAIGDRGSIGGPYQPKPGPNGKQRKPMYYFNLVGFEQVQATITMLWQYLGPQKRLQALIALQNSKREITANLTSDIKKIELLPLKPVQKRRPRLSAEVIQGIREAKKAGVNQLTIMERFGVSKLAVRQHTKDIPGRDMWCFNGHKRTEENTRIYIRARNGKESAEKVCLVCEANSRPKAKATTEA